jgi:hypothetical protein
VTTNGKHGYLIGRLGLPGTGKSHFVRSAAKVGKVWVAVTDPQELHGYPENGVETKLFYDAEWLPELDLFNGNGWGALLKELYALKTRADVTVVGIDSMTGASDLISHDVRKMTRSPTLKEVGEYGKGYIDYSARLNQLLTVLKLLAIGGKHVVCNFHLAEKEQEGAGTAKLVNGELEFEDRLLPVLERGRDVQSIAGHFALWLYSVVTGFGSGTRYQVRSVPDQANPAKTRVAFDAKKAPNGIVNNDFGDVLAALP